MRINVITYHAVLNYGAALQAYALQKYLSDIGNEVQIVDFRRKEDKEAYRILKVPRNLKGAIKMFLSLAHYSQLRIRKNRFAAFLQDNSKLTQRYTCLQDFERNPLSAEVFITGSDQVWNCSNGVIPEFFLDFDVGTAKRASYAASIGVSSIPEKFRAEVGEKLESFHAISVRERDAQRILKTEIGVEAVVACDPVLLLDRSCWDAFLCEKAYTSEKYILCYSLLYNDEVQKCINEMKGQLNLPVYILSGNGYIGLLGDKVIRDAGPVEFLNWVYHAEYVICCSFHGTVFSTIFNKRFVSVVDHSKPSRVTEFLEQVGRSDCIYSGSIDVSKQNSIDEDSVNSRIRDLRKSGVDFLNDLLME